MINATLVVGKVLQQLKRKVTAWHDGILLPAQRSSWWVAFSGPGVDTKHNFSKLAISENVIVTLGVLPL